VPQSAERNLADDGDGRRVQQFTHGRADKGGGDDDVAVLVDDDPGVPGDAIAPSLNRRDAGLLAGLAAPPVRIVPTIRCGLTCHSPAALASQPMGSWCATGPSPRTRRVERS
jgi:hypothetical protein